MKNSIRREQPANVTNIRSHRKYFHFNLGVLIFGALLVYIIYLIVSYANQTHIIGYEVVEGTLTESAKYKGVAIRTEETYYSSYNGYINYYMTEGERAGYGNLIYTVDESGNLKGLLEGDNAEISNLTEEELINVKKSLQEYSSSFDSDNFDSTYEYLRVLNNEIMQITNNKVIESATTIHQMGIYELVNYGYSSNSGYIVYSIDGMETLDQSTISADTFQEDLYASTYFDSNRLVQVGDPIYKMITSELWSIVVPLDEKGKLLLEGQTVANVKFIKTQDSSWANVELFEKDSQMYAILSFNNSVMAFSNDRFIDIELQIQQQSGLKIPVSSIANQEFFLIPTEYITKGGNSSNDGVLRETYDEEGQALIVFEPVSIYYEKDGYYYIEQGTISYGDRLHKTGEEDEVFTVSAAGSLIGVYNINKGFADFKQITILAQNNQYAIIQPNSTYGLTVYDRIVLNASSVEEDDFIH